VAILAGFESGSKYVLEDSKNLWKRTAAIQRQIVGVQQTVSGNGWIYAEPETESDGNSTKPSGDS